MRMIRLALLLLTLLLPGLVWADITTSLQAYWKFDGGTGGAGTTVPDDSGNGHTGTLAGTFSWVTGNIGPWALDLNSDTAAMSWTAITVGTNMTMAAWIYPSTNPNSDQQGLILTSTGAAGFSFYNTTNKLLFDANVPSFSTGTITLNTWTHVAVTISAGSGTFYINGSASGTFSDSGSGINIAIMGASSPYNSRMRVDDVRYYTRALSSGDITELVAFTGAVARKKPPLVY